MGETGLSGAAISSGDSQNKQSSDPRRSSGAKPMDSPTTTDRNSARSGNSMPRKFGEKRARKVRFYRNGDRFFKGMIYAVSTERFRTFESLLTSLTSSPLCDSKVMPNGVRHIFSTDGSHRVDSLDQLQDGESYVCASTDVFRNLDYCKNEDPKWNAHIFPHHNTIFHQSEMSAAEEREYEEYQRSLVVPRLITVLRNGRRPRRAVRLLLNKKTAQSFQQIMDDISDAIKLDCGAVKKLFSVSGGQVTCLADFFGEDTVFLACGLEKISAQDFELDRREVRQVSAYRPFTGKVRERITLRQSPGSSTISKSSDQPSTITSPISENVHSVDKSSVSSLQGAEDIEDTFDISQVSLPVALTNKYEVRNLIGTGNFAAVLECKEKRTQRKYALKIINKDNCKGKEKMLDNEVRILRCVKHPNIIRLVEDYTNQHQIFYIMELVKGGDLFDAIASTSSKYTEQDASGMIYNLASALEYLHSIHIVHRDVKPENILIRQHEDGTKSLKLGDFGLATEVTGPLYTVCGTPTYVAPEVIAETGYGVKIDVWSAGVIGYILLSGFPPFSSPSDNQDELFDLILTGNYDFPSPYWDDVTPSAKNLISRMLETDPTKRLSATQVLDHKWVASDTHYDNDLKNKVSKGLSTYFRRGPKSSHKYAGIKIIATTALDKASRYFQGRGAPHARARGREE